MNFSLISLPITEGDPQANLQKAEQLLKKAMTEKPALVCFPEMSVVNDGYPWGQYRHLAQPVPGKFSGVFCKLAQTHQVHLAVGLLEHDSGKFYSTAILIDPKGKIILKHRKVGEGKPYSCGKTFNVTKTILGTVMFAVCADIWTPEFISAVTKYQPHYIIVPADICGNENERGLINSDRQPDDLAELKEQWIKISKLAESKLLVTNCYCKDTPDYCTAFGGAFVFDNGTEHSFTKTQPGQWRQAATQPIYHFMLQDY